MADDTKPPDETANKPPMVPAFDPKSSISRVEWAYKITRRYRLKARESAALVNIMHRARGGKTAVLAETIAADTGQGERVVRLALTTLADWEIIERKRTRGASIYTPNPLAGLVTATLRPAESTGLDSAGNSSRPAGSTGQTGRIDRSDRQNLPLGQGLEQETNKASPTRAQAAPASPLRAEAASATRTAAEGIAAGLVNTKRTQPQTEPPSRAQVKAAEERERQRIEANAAREKERIRKWAEARANQTGSDHD